MANGKASMNYEWSCHACQATNTPNSERCGACGCPSIATMRQIDSYRDNRAVQANKASLQGIKAHWPEFLIFLVLTLLLFILLLWPDFFGGFNDLEKSGQLGDFVGGYLGTIFTIASVVLLLSNLRNQIAASKIQNFENKYFELIKLHRDNVAEFEIGKMTGRKVFVSLVREFQSILSAVRTFKKSKSLTSDQILCISYYALFFGVGPNSTRMLSKALSGFDQDYVDDLMDFLENADTKARIKSNGNLAYEPLDGHQSRLGHYYRHLYQTVAYVDSQSLNIEKYDYVKTIRAQLTNYEQALLLINSLTPLGKQWWDKGLLKKYRMVQNIPQDFFNPKHEIDINRFFDGSNDFEWQEHNMDYALTSKPDPYWPIPETKSLFG